MEVTSQAASTHLRVSSVLLVLALAGGGIGCARRGSSSETFVDEAADVPAYAEAQREELESLAAQQPADVVPAAVTLARPSTPAEVRVIVEQAGVEPMYYEWLQHGTRNRGGDGWADVVERSAEFPGLRVIYFTAEARASTWEALATDPRVWLVDIQGQMNLYDFAVEAGLVAPP